ncbi:MAG TPA: hypothetical protein V6D47_03195 [Oscillatoriaceae cyanobacterium]
MGGVVKAVTNVAKDVVTAPAKLAGGALKLAMNTVMLPATLTSKALAKICPPVFGPLDQKFGQLRNFQNGLVDFGVKATNFLPSTALDVGGRTTAAVVQTPFNVAGAALGVKPPY